MVFGSSVHNIQVSEIINRSILIIQVLKMVIKLYPVWDIVDQTLIENQSIQTIKIAMMEVC